MANNTITTSIVIDFKSSSEGDALLTAEVDGYPEVDGGLNKGETSFKPGDQPAYLVFYSSNVSILDHVTSLSGGAGYLSLGTRLVDVEEFVTFANEKEVSLSKPAASSVSVTWYGTNLGSVTLNDSKTKLQVASEGVAVAKVSYKATAHQFRLTGNAGIPSGTKEYQILVYIAGQES